MDLNDFKQKREEHLTLLKTKLCYEASTCTKVEHGFLSLIKSRPPRFPIAYINHAAREFSVSAYIVRRYDLTWVRVDLGTELTRVRVDSGTN